MELAARNPHETFPRLLFRWLEMFEDLDGVGMRTGVRRRITGEVWRWDQELVTVS